jgi:adenine deaminase
VDELQELRQQIEAALGRRPLDLLLRNVRLVNVYAGEVVETDIGVQGGRVVSVLPGMAQAAVKTHGAQPRESLDARGLYALPGFIDAHIHVESALLTPARLAEVIVPKGTTTLFVDPMEVANVGGYAGVEALVSVTEGLPCRLFVEVPSRVPTAPGLETAGAELGLADVERMLAWENVLSLGELDPSKVLGLSEEHLKKVLAARGRGKIANGHAIGLRGAEIEAYATARLSDDHECVTFEQLQERLAVGMAVMVREGSSERNLVDLLTKVVELRLDTRHLMFCTDDKHPSDIKAEGHINYNVNQAIRLGLAPVQAIQMATLNAAQHFRVEDRIGAIAPGRFADILLSPTLDRIEPEVVFVGGRLVAQDGQLVVDVSEVSFPGWLRQTVHVTRGTKPTDFLAPASGPRACVRVIEIVPDQITNHLISAWLQVEPGGIKPDLVQDVLKLAVVERHGKNGNLAIGWVKGFGLKRGAIASSVAHDHHNLLIVGANDEDMAACVRALVESQGGFVAAEDGRVLSRLALPLAGLMSEATPGDVDRDLLHVRAAATSLGCELPTPFMTLSFVSLPSIPEAGMSDYGLIDVAAHELIPVIVDEG